ncbi:uncharacterized protein LOC115962527 isoform X1 [Quercus lobata]|uniref:Ribosomal protein L34Ae n=1 Tax=Quercus lobata TaxID=97700 RepID=A0A7N2MRE1_QUELO|nr:uncharacterized protein LOC115962527 isoform X1 [Quercus lobata]
MPCSEKEALVRLFYNVSSSFQLLFLFLYCSSFILPKFFHFLGRNPIIQRNQNRYEYNLSEDEAEVEVEEEEEDERYFHVECNEKDLLVADIIGGGESLLFLPKHPRRNQTLSEEFITPQESLFEDPDEDSALEIENLSVKCVHESDGEHDVEDVFEEEIPTRDADSVYKSETNQGGPSMLISKDLHKSEVEDNDKNCDEDYHNLEHESKKSETTNFSEDEKFFTFAPPKSERKKSIVQEKEEDEIFGDSCTAGSTSKSSSEWRSSVNYSEDPLSSSSRRSCPKWESYTMFQKYDEEMMFLDRISAQKLHETESLRSVLVGPRSMSERIVHKISTIKKRPSDNRRNPYHELEAAYVAQICLTWEALNWNYKNFLQKRASWRDNDPGCPAHVAQEFQQFQVLLQRYIENEPYEQGRRPEIYARMRLLAPKLLLVPEYRDSEDDQKEDGFGSRISSDDFLLILEDGIRTFMNFLKADKEKPCQVISAFFRRNRRGSVDPTLLHLMKKVNQKKKMKLKDLRHPRVCLMRKRKLKVNEEMEILMGLIDLKVVSRVLRMNDIVEEQTHWCEAKMSKVRVVEGKLQRDSSPLFFPAH